MKKLLVSLLLITNIACNSNSSNSSSGSSSSASSSLYYAVYGTPDQSVLQPCTGEQPVVRPVLNCYNSINNQQVNISLCYNLPPVLLTLPSPKGIQTIPINGGSILNSCDEGSTIVKSYQIQCNPGYIEENNSCITYNTTGSYVVMAPQFYQNNGQYILYYLIGAQIEQKVSSSGYVMNLLIH